MMQNNEGWKIKIGCYEKQQCRSHLKKKKRMNMECIKACRIVCDCGVLMHK